jgi:hypothetical protein
LFDCRGVVWERREQVTVELHQPVQVYFCGILNIVVRIASQMLIELRMFKILGGVDLVIVVDWSDSGDAQQPNQEHEHAQILEFKFLAIWKHSV